MTAANDSAIADTTPTRVRTDAELLTLASRFTVNRNDGSPGDRAHYRSDLVLHIERERTGRWFIRQTGHGGSVYNVDTGDFDEDWTFRHAEDTDRDAYLLDRDTALELASVLPREVLTGHDTTWKWQR